MELYEFTLLTSTGVLLICFYLFTCYHVCGLNPNRKETLRQASYQLKVTNINVDNRRFQFKNQNIQMVSEPIQEKYIENQENSAKADIPKNLLPFANEVKLEMEQ